MKLLPLIAKSYFERNWESIKNMPMSDIYPWLTNEIMEQYCPTDHLNIKPWISYHEWLAKNKFKARSAEYWDIYWSLYGTAGKYFEVYNPVEHDRFHYVGGIDPYRIGDEINPSSISIFSRRMRDDVEGSKPVATYEGKPSLVYNEDDQIFYDEKRHCWTTTGEMKKMKEMFGNQEKAEIVNCTDGIMGYIKRNQPKEEKEGLTLEKIMDALAEMFNRPRPKRKMEMPAHDYPGLTDDQFISLVTSDNIKFLGGAKGCDLMLARCKKLGIPVNE